MARILLIISFLAAQAIAADAAQAQYTQTQLDTIRRENSTY